VRLLTETPTHHPKNPVNSENFNHPTQGKVCNPAQLPRLGIWESFGSRYEKHTEYMY
jgi:hypothetical protein